MTGPRRNSAAVGLIRQSYFHARDSNPYSAPPVDVTDIAWSPGDRYLATVGLDSQVLIWCGYTLGKGCCNRCVHLLTTALRPLVRAPDENRPHQGFVKGVCWDPVGEFLATGSDDRSVRIWRTTDWSLEAEVRKPFDHSPGTFFRRLR